LVLIKLYLIHEAWFREGTKEEKGGEKEILIRE
jgi:hypothetical protein